MKKIVNKRHAQEKLNHRSHDRFAVATTPSFVPNVTVLLFAACFLLCLILTNLAPMDNDFEVQLVTVVVQKRKRWRQPPWRRMSSPVICDTPWWEPLKQRMQTLAVC